MPRRHRHHHHHRRSDDHEYLSRTAGMERFRSEQRQLGGLMLVLAVCATVQPLGTIARLVGPSGETPTVGLDLYTLFGAIVQVIIGTGGIAVGFGASMVDAGSRVLTGSLVILTQLAWLPFFADLIRVGRGAQEQPEDNPFIPTAYETTTRWDVQFLGACGIFGILAYGTSFLGALAFTEFSLLAFQNGHPEDRPGLYYRGRASFYNCLVLLAGLSQVLVGAYVWLAFGRNLSNEAGAVTVAMYVVNFPELSCLVGLFQMMTGTFGFIRTLGIMENDHRYQVMMMIQWVLTITVQIVVQVSYSISEDHAALAPTVACLAFGLHALPAFLDYKMRTIPNEIPTDYYDLRGNLNM